MIVALAIVPFLTRSGSASGRVAPRRTRGPGSPRRAAADRHRRDPRRPRHRPAGLRRHPRRRARARGARTRAHARRRGACSPRSTRAAGRGVRPRRGVPAGARPSGARAAVAAPGRAGPRDRGGDGRARHRRGAVLRPGVRGCSTSCSSRAGSLPVRPEHRAAGPAVPAAFWVESDDRGRASSSSRWPQAWVAREPPGAGAGGQRGHRPPAVRSRHRSPRAGRDERRRARSRACSGSRSGCRGLGVLRRAVTVVGAQQAAFASPSLSPAIQWLIGVGVRVAVLRARSSPTSSPTRWSAGVAGWRRPRSCSGSSAVSRRSRSRPTVRGDELAIAFAGPLVSFAHRHASCCWPGCWSGPWCPRRRRSPAASWSSAVLNLILGLLSLVPGDAARRRPRGAGGSRGPGRTIVTGRAARRRASAG